ncbi:hypothetical protein V2A60_008432 [Cordyceps javanica]
MALIAVVVSGPTSNSRTKTVNPKQHWRPSVRDDRPTYHPKDNGPAYNPSDDGPAYNPSDDGPAYNPSDDGPAYNPSDDGPAHNPSDDGPTHNPKDDGPAYNSEDDSPTGSPKESGSDKSVKTPFNGPNGNLTRSGVAPAPTRNSAGVAGDFTVTILADSNRDGKVDLTGDTDRLSKETWSETSGAVFLANIADTDGRCSSGLSGVCGSILGDIFRENLPEEPKFLNKSFGQIRNEHYQLEMEARDNGTEEAWNNYQAVVNAPEFSAFFAEHSQWAEENSPGNLVQACHDASDNILRSSAYLAPLRTTPISQLSDSATGSVGITEESVASKVRIFHNSGGSWKFVSPNYTFKAEDLKAGLELEDDARQEQFVKSVDEMSRAAGLAKPLHIIQTSDCDFSELWAQDFFEPGYTSIPGPNGPIGLYIMIGSAQPYRKAVRRVFQELRSNTTGAVQHSGYGVTTDSTGNLETVPPYTFAGKSYPAGRAIMGSANAKKPQMMAFLEAQETQAPIEIDTSWLAVKHIDEFMQFLPVANSERGWVMMVDDPRAGLEILQKAEQAGHGNAKAVSRPKSPADPQEWHITNTIADVLKVADFAALQDSCAKYIEKNIEIVKRETGITDAEIIRIPSLYQLYQPHGKEIWNYASEVESNQYDTLLTNIFGPPPRVRAPRDELSHLEQLFGSSPVEANKRVLNVLQAGTPPEMREQEPTANTTTASNMQRRQNEPFGEAMSLYPATINSVVLGNNQILAPNPWGPIIEGQDVLAAATTASYAKANYTVRYMDDWFSHHKNIGEVHCGTNVIRDTTGAKWW